MRHMRNKPLSRFGQIRTNSIAIKRFLWEDFYEIPWGINFALNSNRKLIVLFTKIIMEEGYREERTTVRYGRGAFTAAEAHCS